MQSGLDKIGVTCEIAGKPFATMMTDAATVETTPNAAFVVFAGPYLDGGVFLKSRYHSSSCGSWEQMEWLQSDKIDKEITDAMAIADEEERTAAYEKISEELIDLCLQIRQYCQTPSSRKIRFRRALRIRWRVLLLFERIRSEKIAALYKSRTSAEGIEPVDSLPKLQRRVYGY